MCELFSSVSYVLPWHVFDEKDIQLSVFSSRGCHVFFSWKDIVESEKAEFSCIQWGKLN